MVLVNAASGNIFVGLPDPRDNAGRIMHVKKIQVDNELTIGGGGGNIDQLGSMIVAANARSSFEFVSDGTQWYILSQKDATTSDSLTAISDNTILYWEL